MTNKNYDPIFDLELDNFRKEIVENESTNWEEYGEWVDQLDIDIDLDAMFAYYFPEKTE